MKNTLRKLKVIRLVYGIKKGKRKESDLLKFLKEEKTGVVKFALKNYPCKEIAELFAEKVDFESKRDNFHFIATYKFLYGNYVELKHTKIEGLLNDFTELNKTIEALEELRKKLNEVDLEKAKDFMEKKVGIVMGIGKILSFSGLMTLLYLGEKGYAVLFLISTFISTTMIALNYKENIRFFENRNKETKEGEKEIAL